MPRDGGRYDRQVMLPEIGPAGQAALGRTAVLVAGAGGLGSVLCLYLAAAGFGRIIVADHDAVEISNLNRQIIHDETVLGMPKAESAARRVKQLNSTVRVEPVEKKITRRTIRALLDGVDVVVDGCDNYETRAVLNRAALETGVPWVYGGVQRFDGMVSVFDPQIPPCFECVFRRPVHDGNQGIVGPAAGMTAAIQVMETIKLVLNIGTPLKGTLLTIRGLDMRIRTTHLAANPDCGACRHIQGKQTKGRS